MDGHVPPTPPPARLVRGPARLLRGWAGAVVMTLAAAVLHSAASGSPLPSAGVLLFSAVLAAPVCTLLAGRALSLWRTFVAVSGAQLLFHGLYAVAGSGHGVAAAPGVDPAHLGHWHAGAAGAAPALTVTGTAAVGHPHSAGMLAAHVVAAIVTVALLRHGERLVITLAERALEAAPVVGLLAALLDGPRPAPRPLRARAPRVLTAPRSVLTLGTPGRRGPPAFALAA